MPCRYWGETAIASKEAEQCTPSLAPGVNAEQHSDFRKAVWQSLQTLNRILPYDPGIVLLGIYPTDLKTYLHTNSCMQMLIASSSHNHQELGVRMVPFSRQVGKQAGAVYRVGRNVLLRHGRQCVTMKCVFCVKEGSLQSLPTPRCVNLCL